MVRVGVAAGEVDLVAPGPGRLPIEGSYSAGGGMGFTRLSHWNEPVTVHAPANAVPIAIVRG
jgi:hypothetical protein